MSCNIQDIKCCSELIFKLLFFVMLLKTDFSTFISVNTNISVTNYIFWTCSWVSSGAKACLFFLNSRPIHVYKRVTFGIFIKLILPCILSYQSLLPSYYILSPKYGWLGQNGIRQCLKMIFHPLGMGPVWR